MKNTFWVLLLAAALTLMTAEAAVAKCRTDFAPGEQVPYCSDYFVVEVAAVRWPLPAPAKSDLAKLIASVKNGPNLWWKGLVKAQMRDNDPAIKPPERCVSLRVMFDYVHTGYVKQHPDWFFTAQGKNRYVGKADVTVIDQNGTAESFVELCGGERLGFASLFVPRKFLVKDDGDHPKVCMQVITPGARIAGLKSLHSGRYAGAKDTECSHIVDGGPATAVSAAVHDGEPAYTFAFRLEDNRE